MTVDNLPFIEELKVASWDDEAVDHEGDSEKEKASSSTTSETAVNSPSTDTEVPTPEIKHAKELTRTISKKMARVRLESDGISRCVGSDSAWTPSRDLTIADGKNEWQHIDSFRKPKERDKMDSGEWSTQIKSKGVRCHGHYAGRTRSLPMTANDVTSVEPSTSELTTSPLEQSLEVSKSHTWFFPWLEEVRKLLVRCPNQALIFQQTRMMKACWLSLLLPLRCQISGCMVGLYLN
jgi:hypothetical protein